MSEETKNLEELEKDTCCSGGECACDEEKSTKGGSDLVGEEENCCGGCNCGV